MAVIKQREMSLKKKWLMLVLLVILGGVLEVSGLYFIFKKHFFIALGSIASGIILISLTLKKIKILSSGINGEKRIYKRLKSLPNSCRIYNDIQLFNRGRSAQIDHLILSPWGVFCVESKNYKGIIEGKGQDREWKLIKERGKNTYVRNFYNPVMQSKGHAEVVKGILSKHRIFGVRVYSIVVFDEESLEGLKIKSCDIPVVKGDRLIDTIKSYFKRERCASNSVLNKIEDALKKSQKK